MRKPELKRITDALKQLTPIQRKAVSVELAALDAQPASTAVIEGRFAVAASCPHCASEQVRRHGSVKGLQRYFCAECRKTFSALTGTPLNRLHQRGKWLNQAVALRNGLTLHQVANELNIHVSTAHRWRLWRSALRYKHMICENSLSLPPPCHARPLRIIAKGHPGTDLDRHCGG